MAITRLNPQDARIAGNGTTWTALHMENDDKMLRLQVDNGGDVVKLYKSTDGGSSWSTVRNFTDMTYDSGWQTIPASSGFEQYPNQTMRCRRIGKTVHICGAARPTSEKAAGGTYQFGTLPSGFRPAYNLRVLFQGSGRSKWLMQINSDGTLNVERYSDGATNIAIPSGAWLVFSHTFMV